MGAGQPSRLVWPRLRSDLRRPARTRRLCFCGPGRSLPYASSAPIARQCKSATAHVRGPPIISAFVEKADVNTSMSCCLPVDSYIKARPVTGGPTRAASFDEACCFSTSVGHTRYLAALHQVRSWYWDLIRCEKIQTPSGSCFKLHSMDTPRRCRQTVSALI